MKFPFVLRKSAEAESKKAFIAGQLAVMKQDAFNRFDQSSKLIDEACKFPLMAEWEIEAEYVTLMDSKKRTVYIGRLQNRTYRIGDILNIHFEQKK